MNDFTATLLINKLKTAKYNKTLLEEIQKIRNADTTISNWEPGNINIYRCYTLAISLYVAKSATHLPMYIYQHKKALDFQLLRSLRQTAIKDLPSYETFTHTFEYVKDIPYGYRTSNTVSGHVSSPHDTDFNILEKIAHIVGPNTMNFDIDFIDYLDDYHKSILSFADHQKKERTQLLLLQEIKQRANPAITYTILETEIQKRVDLLTPTQLDFTPEITHLKTTIRAMKQLTKDNYAPTTAI